MVKYDYYVLALLINLINSRHWRQNEWRLKIRVDKKITYFKLDKKKECQNKNSNRDIVVTLSECSEKKHQD